MVVMQNKAGQLANRLFAFSHFIGNAIEYDYRLVNPTFDEYRRYFPMLEADNFGALPVSVQLKPAMRFKTFRRLTEILRKRLPNSPWHVFFDVDDDTVFDLHDPAYLAAARGKLVFTNGWQFRDHQNLLKHRDTIRRIFTPQPEVVAATASHRQSLKAAGNNVLVGVHIRRGDYANWQGGIYCFADEVYRARMAEVAQALQAQGRKVTFVLCSNETLNLAAFAPLRVEAGPGEAIQDLYMLAACDLILGPPSTYSLWAAYHGGGELCHLVKGAVTAIGLADFSRPFA